MALKEWDEVIDLDLPPGGPVTEETRQVALREAKRARGSMRVSTGRFWTDQEYEQYRHRIMSVPLP